MSNQNDEQNRITLSIAFIVIYLTIMFGFFKDIIKPPTIELNLFNDIVFIFFLTFGSLIILSFFLYLTFTALDLDFKKKKTIMIEQDISRKKINKIRKFLFYAGVRLIFVSFLFPFCYLVAIFTQKYNFIISILFTLICFSLISVCFSIIFREPKNKNNHKI